MIVHCSVTRMPDNAPRSTQKNNECTASCLAGELSLAWYGNKELQSHSNWKSGLSRSLLDRMGRYGAWSYPSKHEALNKCCFNVGSPSKILVQMSTILVQMSSVCRDTTKSHTGRPTRKLIANYTQEFFYKI